LVQVNCIQEEVVIAELKAWEDVSRGVELSMNLENLSIVT
jgi:hypothetical protein